MMLKVHITDSLSQNEESTWFFLVVMVLIFTFFSVSFILLLLISKLSKKAQAKKLERFIPVIDKALLGMLFENKSIEEIRKEDNFQRLFRKKVFRELLIENMIKLHTSFSGDYREKLELFYRTAGLHDLSARKLKRLRWHIRCEGINELSRMQIQEIYPALVKLTRSRNNAVKLELMVGMIRLKGTQALMDIASHPEPINDWIQLNIISVVKNAGYPEMPDFAKFLESKNESVVLLGIRLINTFGQMQHLPRIKEIVAANHSRGIQLEGERIFGGLSHTTIEIEKA